MEHYPFAIEMSIVRLRVIVSMLRSHRCPVSDKPSVAIIVGCVRFGIVYQTVTMQRTTGLSHYNTLHGSEHTGHAVIVGMVACQVNVARSTVHLNMSESLKGILILIEESTVTMEGIVLEAELNVALGYLHARTFHLVIVQIIGMVKEDPLRFLLTLSLRLRLIPALGTD